MSSAQGHPAAVTLAEALQWLQQYLQPQHPSLATDLAFAAAITRNVLAPFINGAETLPVHIAVVGGAGCGKSTVVNFLLGQVVAETNPQAGYTRHPTAFVPAEVGAAWPQLSGFLQGLQPVTDARPADQDMDIYQIRRLAPSSAAPLQHCIVWDCPDMTAWAAQGYLRRLLEVAALADLLIFVASDERYNDLVPTQFLHLLVRAGKRVIVVLTKVAAEDAPRLVEHFQREVLGCLPRRADGLPVQIPVVVLPFLPAEPRRKPNDAGAPYRRALVNQVMELLSDGPAVRQQHVQSALHFLRQLVSGLQKTLAAELEEFRSWQELVHQGRITFERRYEAEYLESERFAVIERCRHAWVELLELPAAGRWLSAILWVLRLPYRVLRDYVNRWWEQKAVSPLQEAEVLRDAALAWRDTLHTETLRRVDRHPFWQQLAQRFSQELLPAWSQQWDELCRGFTRQEQEALVQSCQRLLDHWQQHPGRLAAARLAKVVLDITGIAAVVWWTWSLLDWYALLLAPLSASLTHQVVEWLGVLQVENLRQRLRQQRSVDLRRSVSEPLEAWLCQWPTRASTPWARLQQVVNEAPLALQSLEAAAAARWSTMTTTSIATVPAPSGGTAMATPSIPATAEKP
jgi:GTPase SAR1 family protein